MPHRHTCQQILRWFAKKIQLGTKRPTGSLLFTRGLVKTYIDALDCLEVTQVPRNKMSELESEKAAAAAEVAEIDSDMDKAKSLSTALKLSTSDKSHCLHKSVQPSSCPHGQFTAFDFFFLDSSGTLH